MPWECFLQRAFDFNYPEHGKCTATNPILVVLSHKMKDITRISTAPPVTSYLDTELKESDLGKG